MTLDDIVSYFTGYGPLQFDSHGNPSSDTLKVATAAILWECCLADENLEDIEVDRLTSLLKDAFHISEKEVEVVSAVCQLNHSGEKMNAFVEAINENFDLDQRKTIVDFATKRARVNQDRAHTIEIVFFVA